MPSDLERPRSTETSVCAVIVTYAPEMPRLTEALARTTPQVDAVVVVDNGPGPVELHGVEVIRPGRNVGLAAAQNLGIAWARDRPHTHVLLLDQDSWPDPGMVATLSAAASDGQVAAVGPRHRDPRTGTYAPFLRVSFPMSRKIRAESGTVRTDFLISSGSLIALDVLDAVGDMDESLFIDNVDLDWCFRAVDRGYVLHGVAEAHMDHQIGDRRSRVLGIAQVAHHPPTRLYFIMRNRVALYRRRHTPLAWIAQDIPRVAVKLITFGLLLGPRWANLRHMVRGLNDGLRENLGPGPYGVVHAEPPAGLGSTDE